MVQLRKLADLYKRPMGVFYLAAPPPDDALPTDYRTIDRNSRSSLSPSLRFSIRAARARREAALELMEELGEEPPDFEVKARLSENPENVGARLREALNLPVTSSSGDPRDGFNECRAATEKAGVLVFQSERVSINEMRGFSLSERPFPVIVLNIKDAYAARSFSLFHELAHIILNRSGLCLVEEDGPPDAEVRRVEAYCNHVAGAALLPALTLASEVDLGPSLPSRALDQVTQAVAGRHGISVETVLRRLVLLGLVPSSVYRAKRQEYLEQYERLALTKRGGLHLAPASPLLAQDDSSLGSSLKRTTGRESQRVTWRSCWESDWAIPRAFESPPAKPPVKARPLDLQHRHQRGARGVETPLSARRLWLSLGASRFAHQRGSSFRDR